MKIVEVVKYKKRLLLNHDMEMIHCNLIFVGSDTYDSLLSCYWNDNTTGSLIKNDNTKAFSLKGNVLILASV